MYINVDYIIIIANYIFILSISKIKKIIIKILIRNLESKIYYFDKYIILIFYIKRNLSNNIRIFIEITREIYIVDNLKINILIDLNILILERIIIDFTT